jgi:hypothetical protein
VGRTQNPKPTTKCIASVKLPAQLRPLRVLMLTSALQLTQPQDWESQIHSTRVSWE